MKNWAIEVETIAAGQPRPYADSQIVLRVTYHTPKLHRSMWKVKDDIARQRVLDDLKALGYISYEYDKEKGDESTGWWKTYLDYCCKVEEGPPVEPQTPTHKVEHRWPSYTVWEVRTVRPYDD